MLRAILRNITCLWGLSKQVRFDFVWRAVAASVSSNTAVGITDEIALLIVEFTKEITAMLWDVVVNFIKRCCDATDRRRRIPNVFFLNSLDLFLETRGKSFLLITSC
jgi:hypothetical protein